MGKRGLSIVNIIIIIVYGLIILIPIAFVLSFLGAQPWWGPMTIFLRTTCFGGAIISLFMYVYTLFLLIVSKPLYSKLFPTTDQRFQQKLKRMMPVIGGIVGFMQYGMQSCRIWYILGVDESLHMFYTVVIYLCIAFLGVLYLHP